MLLCHTVQEAIIVRLVRLVYVHKAAKETKG